MSRDLKACSTRRGTLHLPSGLDRNECTGRLQWDGPAWELKCGRTERLLWSDAGKLMRKILPALLFSIFLEISVMAQVSIAPSTPPGVAAGACVQFRANHPGTWGVTCRGAGCQAGTIDANGLYCSPAVVLAKN
jgi:hypothetical protein